MDQNPEEQADIQGETTVGANHKTDECVLNYRGILKFQSLDRKANKKRRSME